MHGGIDWVSRRRRLAAVKLLSHHEQRVVVGDMYNHVPRLVLDREKHQNMHHTMLPLVGDRDGQRSRTRYVRWQHFFLIYLTFYRR